MVRQKFEVRVFGLKRSGNHPIINWLCTQFPKPVLFLNNIEPGQDPYLTNYDTKLLDNCIDFWKRSREDNRLMDKFCLMYSYEDVNLTGLANHEIVPNPIKKLGKSKYKINIIVLRDPFNMLASRLKASRDNTRSTVKMTCGEKEVKAWKVYAKEVCLKTSNLNAVIIDYNKWFKDKLYRGRLATSILFPEKFDYDDSVVKKIPKTGKGSSFTKFEYDGKAQKMRVLHRWKKFRDDPEFQKLFLDDELLDLANQLYPEMEEAFEWARSLRKN